MSLLGTRLNLLIGPTIPLPVPSAVTEALESVEVTQKDEGCSGFQLKFRIGRGPASLLDTSLLSDVLSKANVRVIITLIHGAVPCVLSDGIVTQQQLIPGEKPGDTMFVISGQDVSLVMDREQVNEEHPAQPELVIVNKICLKYALYGLIPEVIPPLVIDPPVPVERIPVQRETDLRYIKRMANRYGYVFYVEPGPVPATNIAYWGPPKRLGKLQPPLSVNMGAATNVKNINFGYDSEKPAQVSGSMQDRHTNKQIPAQSFSTTRVPLSAAATALSAMRTLLPPPKSGISAQLALGIAQGLMDRSFDQVVTVTGTTDMLCYNSVLQPRQLVGLRGAGGGYDGTYYVESVTHKIAKESYEQEFKITRDGLGSLVPLLAP